MAAGNEIGMGLFWHYCGASPYEYYYTDVRITPQSLALGRSPNVSRVVLVVYLNWVNSVAYQVPIAYVTPLTLAVNTLGCLFQVILTLDAYRIKNHIQVSDATSRSARKTSTDFVRSRLDLRAMRRQHMPVNFDCSSIRRNPTCS